jgi:glyoxylate reductase
MTQTSPNRPYVYITRRIPDDGIRLLQEYCGVGIWEGDEPLAREKFLDEASRADGVLTMLTDRVDAEFFDCAPNIKVVSNYAVGFDNIDIPEATRRGIPIGHTPDVLTESCADHAFALMLAGARRLSEAQAYVKEGHWQTWSPLLLLGRDVHGATLGIIGMGRIGQAIAKRATGFNMRILYSGRRHITEADALGAEWVTQEELLRESDFVSLSVPLNDKTHHLINAEALAQMKPTAMLINTARGAIVDHDALLEALREGKIAGAALDVTDPEPIPSDHPLLDLPNCLVVPHIASATHATRDAIGILAARNLLAGLWGETLPNCVNCADLTS